MSGRVAFAIDLGLVWVFVVIGRLSHHESLSPSGLAATAWPFLVGFGLGWLLTLRFFTDPWRLTPGVTVWLSTVVGGLLIRHWTGQGTATPFMLVATITLAVFLLGWRLARWLAPSARSAPHSGPR